jgi:hypothetical protein
VTPSSVPILDTIIVDDTLSASVFRTYCRLISRAWRHNYQRTDPIDLTADLMPLLGLAESKVYIHLNTLKAAKMIRWSTNGRGSYTFTFPSRSSDGLQTDDQQPRQQGQQGTGSAGPHGLQSASASAPAATHQAATAPQTAQLPKTGVDATPQLGNCPDLHEEEDEEELINSDQDHLLHLHQTDPTPENGSSEIFDRAYRAIVAGGVWSDEAAQQAQRFAAGSARLTVRDLLENVAYVHDPESDIDKPGAIMRIHVRAQRKSPRHYPNLPADFDAALEWATHPDRWGDVEVPIVSPSLRSTSHASGDAGEGRSQMPDETAGSEGEASFWNPVPSHVAVCATGEGQGGGRSIDQLWTAICDRVIARNVTFFDFYLRDARPVSLTAGTFTLRTQHHNAQPLRDNLDKLTAIVADIVEDDAIQIQLVL